MAITVVSPRTTIPSGMTYCHSGPSCSNAQLRQVRPPSVERPQPLPTVPYQISLRGPNAIACTKSMEIEVPLESRRIRSQVSLPGGRRKMPSP